MFGKGDGSFEQPVTYTVTGSRLRVADLNRDGWLDLVEVTGFLPGGRAAAILLNNGNGTFQTARSVSIPPNSLILGVRDVNGDGKLDLVTVDRSGIYGEIRTVSVLLGNGDGTFRSPLNSVSDWGGGSGPYSIILEDFDRDGRTDVALADEYLTVLVGVGNDYY